MDRYTNLNLYGHLALELGSDNNSSGLLLNVPTSDISFLRFTGASPVVHGLDPGHSENNNKVLIVTFLGTGSLTFKHLSGLNSSNNFRIKTPNGEDYVIPINYGSILIYDSYDHFWHIVGEAKLAAGSNGQIQFNNNGSLKGSPNFSWDINNNILNVSGTTYSIALFDDGKRVATLTGTETLQNKTLVSPLITGTLTFGEIPFYQYGHHGLSIFEDVDLSQSTLQTVYNFGTPDSEKSSVLSLSVKDEYKAFIGTAGANSLNIFTIGSTSSNTNFQIRKGISTGPIDVVTGGTQLLLLTYDGQLFLPSNIPSTSYDTGALVVNGGVGINGQTYFNDNLNLLRGKSLRFYDSDSSNFIEFKSPNSLSFNFIYTLPSNFGSASQVLTTNGSGTLSFDTIYHNNLPDLQGGGNSNYYHSDQPINISNTVQFAGLNINAAYSFPMSDGINTQVLTTNGSGTLSFNTIYHNNLPDLQGGGNGNYYHSNQPINNTDSVSFAGLNVNNAYSFPVNDGINKQFLSTNGSGTLSFNNIIHNDTTAIQGGGGGNYYHSNQPINTSDSVQFGGIESTKEFKLSGVNTITTSGSLSALSTQNISIIKYDSTSQGTLHGLADGVEGKIIIITVVNAGKILLTNDSIGDTTPTNRILIQGGVNLSIRYRTSAVLQYDSSVSRWRVINRYAHNDSSELQGGDGTNYYHSNQPVNITDSVQFAGLNINGQFSFPIADGTNNQALLTNGSGTLSFQNVLRNLIEDASPQLGGNLDVNGYSIVSTSNANINLAPNGTGKVNVSGTLVVSNITYPTLDGTVDQIIATNGSGTLGFVNLFSGYNYGNISSSSVINLNNIDTIGYFTHTNASSSVLTLTNGKIGKTYKIIGISNGVQYSFSSSGIIKWPTTITPIISSNNKSDLFVFECIGTNKYIGYYFYNYDSTGLF